MGIVTALVCLFALEASSALPDDQVPPPPHRATARRSPGMMSDGQLPFGPVSPVGRPQISPRYFPQQRPARSFSTAPFRHTSSASVAPNSRQRVTPRQENGNSSRENAARNVRSNTGPQAAQRRNEGNSARAAAHRTAPKSRTRNEEAEQSTGAKSQRVQRPEFTAPARPNVAPAQNEVEHTMIIPTRTPLPENVPLQLPEQVPMQAPAPFPSAPTPERGVAAVPPLQAAPLQAVPRQQRPVLNQLSPEERSRIQSAHAAVLHDANVAASRARYLNARKEFREKLRDALLKADPSVQPILEKIQKGRSEDH